MELIMRHRYDPGQLTQTESDCRLPNFQNGLQTSGRSISNHVPLSLQAQQISRLYNDISEYAEHTLPSRSAMPSWIEMPIPSVGFANDIIPGTSGNDVLIGTAGDDVRDGGAGTDTAVFSSPRSAYTVQGGVTGAGRNTVTVSGPEGVDALIDVERLAFEDGTLVLASDDTAFQAFRLYRAALGRTPDTGGLGYQTTRLDQGTTLENVAAGFIASPEFEAKYGALSNSAYVSQLYQNVLGRGAASNEIAYHVGRLDQGVSRQGVLIGFSESPENIANTAPLVRDGIWFTGWDVL